MKQTKILAMILTLSLILSGCQEVENPEALIEMTKTTLVENVDLSAVTAPEEVSVYSAALWEQRPEKVAGIFLGNDFTEGKADAIGRRFIKNAGKKQEIIVQVCDGGRTYFGDGGHAEENGIIYFRNDLYKIGKNSEGFEKITEQYDGGSGTVTDGVPDEKEETFLAVKEKTSKYLEQLGMEGYALDAATTLATKKQKNKKSYWMAWKQWIDGIPISDTVVRRGPREVYNFRQGFVNPKLNSYNSFLEAMYVGNELADMRNAYVVHADKAVKKSPVVPVRQAYQKVEECYPPEKTGTYTLERAELQYELIEQADHAGKYYLYPLWVFTVHEDEDDVDEPGDWVYYLVDVITGELFIDFPEELLQQ